MQNCSAWQCPTCNTTWSVEPTQAICAGPDCTCGENGGPVIWCPDCVHRAAACYGCDGKLCSGCVITDFMGENVCFTCHNTCCVCGEEKRYCDDVPSEGRVCAACRRGRAPDVFRELGLTPEMYALRQQEILEWAGVQDAS